MAVTKLDIINTALTSLGADIIVPSDSRSGFATSVQKASSYQFDSAVRYLLSTCSWTFLVRQETLRNPIQRRDAEFEYHYSVPEDFDRAIAGLTGHFTADLGLFALTKFIGDLDTSVISSYRVEGDMVSTNLSPLILVYLTRNEEAILGGPSYFIEALTSILAYKLCVSIVKSPSLKGIVSRERDESIRMARNQDVKMAKRYYEETRNSNFKVFK